MACENESCLDGIVTVRDVCSGEETCPTSGFDMMDAPEITVSNLAAIANEKYVSGLNLAKSILKLAVQRIQNDLIAVLNTNGISTGIQNPIYTTSIYKSATVIPMAPLERGITISRNSHIRGYLRKVILTKVDIYPASSGTTELLIYDNNTVSRYSVELTGGQINTFLINHILQGPYARVLIDTTTIDVFSTHIVCKTGCNGTVPNPCGDAESFDGYSENRTHEGYGLNVYFSCQCDYTQFMCDLSQTYVGELIYLKARIMLLEEHLKTNRFNDWIVYNREQTQQNRDELTELYTNRWNALVEGMYGILKNYHDDCLICRGISWVVNG